jgi:outer membrane lipoprotein-sorting protein
MGEGGSMPLDIDAMVEVYISKPHNLYIGISGNLGNARLIVSGKEKSTATIVLPGTKQFTTMNVPERIKKQIDVFQEPKEKDAQEPDPTEDLWKQVILEYDGTENLKTGKAHKIIIKPKDPAEKSSLIAHILDGKWDPARLEITEEEGSNLLLEFEKLEFDTKIPDEKFVPDTEGYTEVTQETIVGSIMMQIMSSMMQKSTEE